MQMMKALGAYFLMPGADLLHHLEIDAEEIIAAHAGLARNAGGDDADTRALDRLVGIGAGHLEVVPVDRRRLHEVEALALWNALGDVEQHHVAKVLETDKVCQGAADLACADQCNLVTRHVGRASDWSGQADGGRGRRCGAS